ncbi:plasma membrane protein Pth11-like protein [Xylariaceae sp. FL1019]|nr:plasma membrane protein Pth11-like protein [Xylariaceae sp. FL1019]
MVAKQQYFETPSHVIAACTVLPFVDLLTVVVRFRLRRKLKHGLKADDWLILIATVLTLGMGATIIYGVAKHSIAHRFVVPMDMAHDPFAASTPQAALTGKIQLAVLLMLPLTLGCIKGSFITFYMRIFAVSRWGWTHKLLLSMSVLVALWTTAFFFAQLFACRLDFYAYWRSTNDLLTKCVETEQLFLALSITDFVTDIAIITIPIPLVWRLNLSRQRKIVIVLIFSLGAVSIAASLTRLIFTSNLVRNGFDPNDDTIFVITNGLYWGAVECSVAILAANLPTLQSVLRISTWETLISKSRTVWDITSSKTHIIRSKASKFSLRRERDGQSIDSRSAKNESMSLHSTVRQGETSAEPNLGIEMPTLDRTLPN